MTTNRTPRNNNGTSLSLIDSILSADLATSGTVVVNYPPGKDRGNYLLGTNHAAVVAGGDRYVWPRDFTIAFNAASMTITWRAATTLKAGTRVVWQLDEAGNFVRDGRTGNLVPIVTPSVAVINLGSPEALVTDGICLSQNRTGAGPMVINGSLAVGGVVQLDVPRNAIADSGGADTAVITVIGEDFYGQPMQENLTLNGTTAVAGVKAFYRITAVNSSATTTNGFFLGTGDVLGLPVFLPAAGLVLREMENLATATAGTLVAGSVVQPSATSADVRGTYDPNSACDGSRTFTLVAAIPDPGFIGGPQFAG